MNENGERRDRGQKNDRRVACALGGARSWARRHSRGENYGEAATLVSA